MDIGGIGGGYSAYGAALSGGPSAAAHSGEAQAADQAGQAFRAQQPKVPAIPEDTGSGSTTRGQNLNITV